MSEKDKILDNYNALFEKDENGKALSEEAFLDRLIALESAGKIRLFRTLLKTKTKQEARDYLNSKGREELEKIVSREQIGKSMTIVDIINQYSKMIKDTFKTKPTKEALNELGIQSDKLDGVILPSEGNQRIRPGTSEGGEESEEKKKLKFKEYQEKIETLFSDILTVENGVHPGDLEVFEGKNEKDIVRYTSYIAVKIPKLGKTIFINDREGESTFVCDKLVSEHDMITKSKKKFHEELGDAFHSVNYSEKKKEHWKLDMIDLIFGPEKGTQKLIRDALMDKNGELTEKGKEWFSLNTGTRLKFKLSNGVGYQKIATTFGVKREKYSYIYKEDAFIELSIAIFGKDNPNVKILTTSQEEIQNEIRNELMNANLKLTEKGKERFSLNTSTRPKFKLSNGVGYTKIAGIYGIEDSKNIGNIDVFYKLSCKIFGEDYPKVKELKEEAEFYALTEEEKQMKIRAFLIDEKGKLIEEGKKRFETKCGSRYSFKIRDWLGYYRIAGIYGIENPKNIGNIDIFYKLSCKIFGEDYPKVKELKEEAEFYALTEEEKQMKIKGFLIDEKGELTEKGKEWFDSSFKSRLKFNIRDGLGYYKIADIYGMGKSKNIGNIDVFYKLSCKIFGEDYPKVKELKKEAEFYVLTEEEKQNKIREILVDGRGELTEKGKERFETTYNSRSKFNIRGWLGYLKIAGIYNVDISDEKLYNIYLFYKLSCKIFGEDYPKVKELKEEAEFYVLTEEEKQKKVSTFLIDEKGKLTEKGRERFETKTYNRSNFKIRDWLGYYKIADIYGMGSTKNIGNIYLFYKLSCKIFGEDYPKVKELKEETEFYVLTEEEKQNKIREILVDGRGELTEKGKEWFDLNPKSREYFKIRDWLSYISIARTYGMKGLQNDLYNIGVFYKLSCKIFGEDYPKVKELKEEAEFYVLTEEEKQKRIRGFFIDEKGELTEKGKEWFDSNSKSRSNFKIRDWLGYKKIAGIYHEKKSEVKDSRSMDGFYKLSCKIFGEYHPSVVELKEKLDKQKNKS